MNHYEGQPTRSIDIMLKTLGEKLASLNDTTNVEASANTTNNNFPNISIFVAEGSESAPYAPTDTFISLTTITDPSRINTVAYICEVHTPFDTDQCAVWEYNPTSTKLYRISKIAHDRENLAITEIDDINLLLQFESYVDNIANRTWLNGIGVAADSILRPETFSFTNQL